MLNYLYVSTVIFVPVLCRIESPNKIVDECDINFNSILNAVLEACNDENVSFNDEHMKISN